MTAPVWDYCPLSSRELHTIYRGMVVHQWNHSICFYPYEGQSSEEELTELLHRIKSTKVAVSYLVLRWHPIVMDGKFCSTAEWDNKRDKNFCIEVRSLADLDALLDAMYQEALSIPS